MSGGVFDLIFFILFIIMLFAVVADNFRVRIKNHKLNAEVEKLSMEYILVSKKNDELKESSKGSNIEKTEGFLKFVSESRDWAFQYIERVQISIKTFQEVFHPIAIEYYKDKTRPINQEEFGKLFEAYKKLVDELPAEGKK